MTPEERDAMNLLRTRISLLESQLQSARSSALVEAAEIARAEAEKHNIEGGDVFAFITATNIALAIRSLANAGQTGGET
jgi:hypothetical protein